MELYESLSMFLQIYDVSFLNYAILWIKCLGSPLPLHIPTNTPPPTEVLEGKQHLFLCTVVYPFYSLYLKEHVKPTRIEAQESREH